MTAEATATGTVSSDLPRLVPGISAWPFFPERRDARGALRAEGMSIVGSLALDRYVTVPDRKLQAVEELLRVLDRCRSCGEAQAVLRSDGLDVDVAAFCDKLRAAGLVLDGDGRPAPAESDFERNFVRLASVGLGWAAPHFAWVGRHLVRILASLFALAAAAASWRTTRDESRPPSW